jgi:hypothetical protein
LNSNTIQFVRVRCDIKPNDSNRFGCFEDEILAVIDGHVHRDEWLTVKNAFNTIGRIQTIFVEPIDEQQDTDEHHELLCVPKVCSAKQLDPLQELIDQQLKTLLINNDNTNQTALKTGSIDFNEFSCQYIDNSYLDS